MAQPVLYLVCMPGTIRYHYMTEQLRYSTCTGTVATIQGTVSSTLTETTTKNTNNLVIVNETWYEKFNIIIQGDSKDEKSRKEKKKQ